MELPKPPILTRQLAGIGTDFNHLWNFNKHRMDVLFAHKPPKFNCATNRELVRRVFITRYLIITKKREWKRKKVKAILNDTSLSYDVQTIIMDYL